jgi:hypothetical protein
VRSAFFGGPASLWRYTRVDSYESSPASSPARSSERASTSRWLSTNTMSLRRDGRGENTVDDEPAGLQEHRPRPDRHQPAKAGASATPGRISKALEGQSHAADSVSPSGLRFATSVTRAHPELCHQGARATTRLDFHSSRRAEAAHAKCHRPARSTTVVGKLAGAQERKLGSPRAVRRFRSAQRSG